MSTQMLERYYELQATLLRLSRRREELSEEIKQAKYDLRSRDEALLNYRGSFRSFLDNISGKREDKTEELRRRVRQAETELAALLREQQDLEARFSRTQEDLSAFPDVQTLRSEGDEKTWASLEAKFCAEALSPLLEENHKALLEYRSLMQGSRMEILTIERQQEICAEPNLRAEQCMPWLLRLKEALEIQGKPFDPGSYYESPVSYLVSVAAKHNRLDRVNRALDQVEQMQKLVSHIQKQEVSPYG